MNVDFVCSLVKLLVVTNTLVSFANNAGLESFFMPRRASLINIIHNNSPKIGPWELHILFPIMIIIFAVGSEICQPFVFYLQDRTQTIGYYFIIYNKTIYLKEFCDWHNQMFLPSHRRYYLLSFIICSKNVVTVKMAFWNGDTFSESRLLWY